jgi:organic hydroperoxide reductase OsmC/OhrA
MSERTHTYSVVVEWTGNSGDGTFTYSSYSRDHRISASGKTDISGSSDPSFRGDKARWNPEELLVAALAACHKLTYLSLCSRKGISVLSYVDHANGRMIERAEGGGRFEYVELRPEVVLKAGSDLEAARALHHQAHEYCFIANSVNFPVECHAAVTVQG